MTDEYVRVILELWTKPSPTFERSLHETARRPLGAASATLSAAVDPDRRLRKRAIRRAVALGQGWLPDGMTLPDVEKAIAFLGESAEAAGYDARSLDLVLRTGLMLSEVLPSYAAQNGPRTWIPIGSPVSSTSRAAAGCVKVQVPTPLVCNWRAYVVLGRLANVRNARTCPSGTRIRSECSDAPIGLKWSNAADGQQYEN